jgi:hypothetical protein
MVLGCGGGVPFGADLLLWMDPLNLGTILVCGGGGAIWGCEWANSGTILVQFGDDLGMRMVRRSLGLIRIRFWLAAGGGVTWVQLGGIWCCWRLPFNQLVRLNLLPSVSGHVNDSCVGLDHCKQFLVLDASSFVLLLSCSFYL